MLGELRLEYLADFVYQYSISGRASNPLFSLNMNEIKSMQIFSKYSQFNFALVTAKVFTIGHFSSEFLMQTSFPN